MADPCPMCGALPCDQTIGSDNYRSQDIAFLLRNCVRPPDLDALMQDAARVIETLGRELTRKSECRK